MPLPYARLAEDLSFDPLSTPECSFDSLSELEYQELAISYRAVPGFQCPELVPPSVMAAEEDEVQYLGSVCAGSASDDKVQYLGSVSAPRVRGSAGSSGFVVTIEVVVVMDNLYNSDLGAIQFFRPFPLLTWCQFPLSEFILRVDLVFLFIRFISLVVGEGFER